MREDIRLDLILGDDHARAELGALPEALREIARQPDTAMRGGTPRQHGDRKRNGDLRARQ